MSELTLPEVRRCLQRIVVASLEGKDDVAAAEARLALHLLTEWTDADMEAAVRGYMHGQRDKGRSTPREVLKALDPHRKT